MKRTWNPVEVSAPRLLVATKLIIVPVYAQYMDSHGACFGKFPWWDTAVSTAAAADFDGDAGKTHEFMNGGSQICLLGLGERPDDAHSTRQHMHVAGLATKRAIELRAESFTLLVHASSEERAAVMLHNFTVGANLALPRETFKTAPVKPLQLKLVSVRFHRQDGVAVLPVQNDPKIAKISGDNFRFIAPIAIEYARAVRQARWDTELPPNVKTPPLYAQMVREAYEAAKASLPEDLRDMSSLEILDEAAIREKKMGLVLAVAGVHHGAHFVPPELHPRLLHFRCAADNPDGTPPIAFVLKGVCFDYGGAQIKDATNMIGMKTDMAAAASLLATLPILMGLRGLRRDIVIIVPLVINGLGPGMMMPDGVYESMTGKTVEIGHTDAEGRLVLADGIEYAAHAGATTIITMATLTGAKQVGLGNSIAALFGNDQELTVRIEAAGFDAGEAVHATPLDQRLQHDMKSEVADIRNANGKREGASITAALFIKHFVPKGVSWAHVDIAGCEWIAGKPNFGHQNSGPTGFGVLTALDLIHQLGIIRPDTPA